MRVIAKHNIHHSILETYVIFNQLILVRYKGNLVGASREHKTYFNSIFYKTNLQIIALCQTLGYLQ